jgi:hypothetical protein
MTIASILFAPMFMAPFILFFTAAGLGVLGLAFWVWMLVDAATKEPATGNEKIAWVLVIVFTSWVGALIYFIARRPERIRLHGR